MERGWEGNGDKGKIENGNELISKGREKERVWDLKIQSAGERIKVSQKVEKILKDKEKVEKILKDKEKVEKILKDKEKLKDRKHKMR